MLTVKLVCVGKLKEKFFAEAFEEYRKRLGAFCRFECAELAEQRLGDAPGAREIAAALEREAADIEKAIPSGAAVVAMCVEGKSMKSEELAAQLDRWQSAGRSRVCFVVGGSFGLSERVKARADLRLSVSRMTFPHHLFRVMLAEQIYRALSISAGTRYHK